MNKSILLSLSLIATPMVASGQGPVGGSDGPGIDFYSTTTGLAEDLDATARRNLLAGEKRLPETAEEAGDRSRAKATSVPALPFDLLPAAPTTADFLWRR